MRALLLASLAVLAACDRPQPTPGSVPAQPVANAGPAGVPEGGAVPGEGALPDERPAFAAEVQAVAFDLDETGRWRSVETTVRVTPPEAAALVLRFDATAGAPVLSSLALRRL